MTVKGIHINITWFTHIGILSKCFGKTLMYKIRALNKNVFILLNLLFSVNIEATEIVKKLKRKIIVCPEKTVA